MPIVGSAPARVAGWREWQGRGGWPGAATLPGTPPVPAFPDVPLDLSVALWVDDSWLDITGSVIGHHAGSYTPVRISRGQSAEGARTDPARASLEINNRDGVYSPRNPNSWLYGKIGRNTMIRVQVAGDTRFCGEVSEWPVRWDLTGTDIWAPLEAGGILRRLQQGSNPLRSSWYRYITKHTIEPVAYWPFEDGAGSTSIASAINQPPLTITGTPDLAANTDIKASDALPTLQGASFAGPVPIYAATGEMTHWLLISVPAGGAANGASIARIYTTGGIAYWDLSYVTGGDIRVRAVDTSDTEVENTVVALDLNGNPYFVALALDNVIRWTLTAILISTGTVSQTTANVLAAVHGRTWKMAVNFHRTLTDTAVGHVAVFKELRPTSDLLDDLLARLGEAAGRRIERLCTEESVDFRPAGDLDATPAMGYQLPAVLVDLLRDAETVDGGILYEPRDLCGLGYRTRENLYNQAARLTLDYDRADLSVIEPTDDDQLIHNDVTVTRVDGSSYRATKDSGALSTQPPPDGIGVYDDQVELSLSADSALPDQAGWRLHLGTVDEARYPQLGLKLARRNFTGNAELAERARAVDVGDRLVVDDPPPWLPPEDITQMALGFTEELGQFTWTIDVNCAPEAPWGQVGVYDDNVSRYSSDASTLAADLDTTSTSVSVAASSGPLWTHADGDYDLMVDGERMTVTAVAGASSPQTFTVTRSVNGIVKTHTAGATVELFHPVVYAI